MGERSQSKKKIHGAKKHRHNLTPAKPSAAKPLKVVMRSVFLVALFCAFLV
jgi:hypothetical protein